MAARGIAAPWASVPPARLPACGPEVHDASISPASVGHQPLLRVLGDARRAQRGREAVMGGVTVRLRKVGHGTEGTRGRLDGTRRLHWMRGWHGVLARAARGDRQPGGQGEQAQCAAQSVFD